MFAAFESVMRNAMEEVLQEMTTVQRELDARRLALDERERSLSEREAALVKPVGTTTIEPEAPLDQVDHDVPRSRTTFLDPEVQVTKRVEAPQVQTFELSVPVPRVEVLQVSTVERSVPVPQLSVQEVIREVVKVVPQEIVRPAPVPQVRGTILDEYDEHNWWGFHLVVIEDTVKNFACFMEDSTGRPSARCILHRADGRREVLGDRSYCTIQAEAPREMFRFMVLTSFVSAPHSILRGLDYYEIRAILQIPVTKKGVNRKNHPKIVYTIWDNVKLCADLLL